MKIILYILAFTFSNLLVVNFGREGLLISSIFLVPFDFIIRCFFHEQWKGLELILKLCSLTIVAALITYLINRDSLNIALGSVFGLTAAQLTAGLFYQKFIDKSSFIKVNGSDLVAIMTDSIVFQLIAFSSINFAITGGQIGLKITGGLFWYWILFKVFKMKLKNDNSN